MQRLVKLLTLKLDVRSELGRGSAFSLVLPASSRHLTAQEPSMRYSGAGPQEIGDARVLVVEDNESVVLPRRATRLLLELEGYHVTLVASLSQALQHVEQGNRVDLLISDYHLNNGEPDGRSSMHCARSWEFHCEPSLRPGTPPLRSSSCRAIRTCGSRASPSMRKSC